jgi:hypothetical protein
MTIDFFTMGAVEVSMKGYIKQLLIDYDTQKLSPSPASNTLFDQDQDQELLSESESVRLHSALAKLLYLSTRIRPDIQLAVNYLCTRVNRYNPSDQLKCERILEYLYATMNKTLTLFTPSFTPIPLTVIHVPTGEMVADILTKPLQGVAYRRLRSLLLNDSH